MYSEQIDVSVRQHHALGVGAGATGVKQFGYGIFVNRRNIRALRRGGVKQRIVVLRAEPLRFRSALQQYETSY